VDTSLIHNVMLDHITIIKRCLI